jgi:hypothetical protein
MEALSRCIVIVEEVDNAVCVTTGRSAGNDELKQGACVALLPLLLLLLWWLLFV